MIQHTSRTVWFELVTSGGATVAIVAIGATGEHVWGGGDGYCKILALLAIQ
ncbi:MAG: hypothetical protein IH914_06545 [candidate division Zixibacteria bacterium]|nr:hypothetical protein [candidate division Zixibacteria bacterium]